MTDVLEALLLSFDLGDSFALCLLGNVVGCVCNYKVDLRALTGHQVSGFFIKVLFDLLVLHFVKDPLQQFLQFILSHNCL